MTIKCPMCGKTTEIGENTAEGQNILCSHCYKKFPYSCQGGGNSTPSAGVTRPSSQRSGKRFWIILAGLVTLSGLFIFGRTDQEKVDLEIQYVDAATCPIDGTISGLISGISVGSACFIMSPMVHVSYVVPDKGVLATDGVSSIYVRTRTPYVDGNTLAFALYTCDGRATVKKSNGDRVTVLAFTEADEEIGRKRLAIIQRRLETAKKAQMIVEEELRMKKEEEKIKRESMRQAQEAEMAARKKENDRKLAELRAEAERKAEEARIAEEKKQAEEAKKRYPQEQKDRAAYAKMKLEAIDFDVASRFLVTEFIRQNMTSLSVNERKFETVRTHIGGGNYLAALSAIKGVELADYPDTDAIRGLIDLFLNQRFHVELKLKTSDVLLHCLKYLPNEKMTADDLNNRKCVFNSRIGESSSHNDFSTWEFTLCLGEPSKILVFDRQRRGGASSPADLYAKLAIEMEQIRNDFRRGKLEMEEADSLIVEAYEKSVDQLLSKVSKCAPA